MVRALTRRPATRAVLEREGDTQETAHLMLDNPEELIGEQNRLARRIASLNLRYAETQRLQCMALVVSPALRRPKRVRVSNTLLASTPLLVLHLQGISSPPSPSPNCL